MPVNWDEFEPVETGGVDWSQFERVNKQGESKADLAQQMASARNEGAFDRAVAAITSGIESGIERITPSGIMNQPARALGYADPFQPGVPVADLPEPTGTGVLSGVGQLASRITESLTTPENLITLPAAAPSAAVRALFAGQMAQSLPAGISHAGDVLRDPNATAAEQVVAAGEPLVAAAMLRGIGRTAEWLPYAPEAPRVPIAGTAIPPRPGAPAPRTEPAPIERATPEQAAAQAEAMNRTAETAVDPKVDRTQPDKPVTLEKVELDKQAQAYDSGANERQISQPTGSGASTGTDLPRAGTGEQIRAGSEEQVRPEPDLRRLGEIGGGVGEGAAGNKATAKVRGRKLLQAEQEFLDAHGITIQEALQSRLIVQNKRTNRYGKDVKTGYSPASADSWTFDRAIDAANKEKELRASAEASKSPDLKLREEVWSAMTDAERREVRRNPKIFDKPEGVLDWEFLLPFAKKYGKINEGGSAEPKPVSRSQVEKDPFTAKSAESPTRSPAPPQPAVAEGVKEPVKVQEVAKPVEAKAPVEKVEQPSFEMTFKQFLDAPREGALLEGLRKLPRPPVSEAARLAIEKTEAAYKKLEEAKLTWVLDNPNQAIGLPKAKKKLVDAYNKAWQERSAIGNAERESKQRFLYDEGVKAGLFKEPAAPPKPTPKPVEPPKAVEKVVEEVGRKPKDVPSDMWANRPARSSLQTHAHNIARNTEQLKQVNAEIQKLVVQRAAAEAMHRGSEAQRRMGGLAPGAVKAYRLKQEIDSLREQAKTLRERTALEKKQRDSFIQSWKQPKPTTAPATDIPQGPERIRPGPGASTLADVGAESAAQSAALRVAEFFDTTAKTPDVRVVKESDAAISESALRSSDPAVEARWQAAKISKPSLLDKVKMWLSEKRNLFTRHFENLDPKTDGVVMDILRVHENVPNLSKWNAAQTIRGITSGLGPNKFDLFSRVVIMRDLIKYSERFKDELTDLPFGYKSVEAMKGDLAKYESLADTIPDVRESLRRRDEFMDALRYDMVSRGLLPEKVKDFREYFHHQVLQYMAMKEPFASTSSPDVRAHEKSWQKRRTGSAKDYNTSYLESEFEVISQSFAQMATQDTLKKLQESADITPQLKEAVAQAKAEGVDITVDDLIPQDHTYWQPEKGNHFYWANSVAEKALEAYFRGDRKILPTDVRDVLAMGGPKERWIIPKRLARTLDDFGPKPDHQIEKFIGAGTSQWKRWTLFNPMRNVIYEINNLSGDLDISIAVDLKILKHAKGAAQDVMQFVRGKAPNKDIADMVKYDVIESGFSVKELPDLRGQQFFRTLEGRNPTLVQRYWETVLDFNRWREGVLRVAAYRRALELIDSGRKPYWTSKRTEMDALYSDPKVPREQIAAKLAREAIGDYGNISAAGQWIRSKMMPFYSWMEINAPRYVRLLQNAPYESNSRARITAVMAKRRAAGATAKTLTGAGGLYMLMNLWNKTMFPEEERELSDTRDQFHIILGRNEDGSVRSLRFQGAFSDALSWFGAENLMKDIHDVASGTASLGDKAEQAAKAPLNKVVNASWPIWKSLGEAAVGRSLYPDVLNPRPIRDKGSHLAQTFSMRTMYDYLTNKPQRPGTWSMMALATYTADPGEAAYNTARGIISDKLKKLNVDRPTSDPTQKSNALYFYKQAVKYKDKRLMEYWKRRYMDLGGTDKGLKQSVDRSAPFAGVSRKDRDRIKAELSPAEKDILDRAEKWYWRTYR